MYKYSLPCFTCKEPFRHTSKVQILRNIVHSYMSISGYSSDTTNLIVINSTPTRCRYGMHCTQLNLDKSNIDNMVKSLRRILGFLLDAKKYSDYERICGLLMGYDQVTASRLLRLLNDVRSKEATEKTMCNNIN